VLGIVFYLGGQTPRLEEVFDVPLGYAELAAYLVGGELTGLDPARVKEGRSPARSETPARFY
jgi:hypothetical protein